MPTPAELRFKAYEFAKKKHEGQSDDLGKDYFKAHVMNVVEILGCCKEVTHEMYTIAWLHDTLEDTDTSYEELVREFGQRVADLVLELTHEGKKDEHGYYFPRLKSKEAIIVKFADRLSNLTRMSCWVEERQQQYLRKSKFWKSELK